MRAHLLTTTAVMALISASTVSTRAQTNWNGLISSDWFTAGNWTPAGVPTLGTSATLGILNNPAVIGSGSATAQSLVVGGSAPGNLTIQNGGTLTTFTGGVVGGQFTTGDVTVTGLSSWQNTNGSIQVGGAFGISTLTVANAGFVNGSFFGGLINVGGGGGFGALIGDGNVSSTQINARGVLAPLDPGRIPGGGRPAR